MCHHRFTFADVWMAVYKKGIRIWNIYRRDLQGLQLHDVPPDIFTYVTNIYLTSGDPRRFGEGISAWLWIIINPCMVFPGDGWIIQYVPKYIDASWPNPIPCCLPHESKKPIAAHSYAAILHEISLPKAFCCLFHCQAYGAGIGAILHRDCRDDMMYLVMESFPKMTSHMVDGVLAPR